MDSNGSVATPIIEITDLTKTYVMGTTEVQALRGVSMTVREGEYVAIIGASGSGKSTLMNMIGLLDRPTNGSYRIRGTEASRLGKNRLADLRCKEIGFVFQRFNLLARATAQRQVELPLFYAGVPSRKSAQMAVEALTRVGLGDRTQHRPEELSGGQQQRVAIARALVNRPGLLLADEPTGALDSKTGQEILALFDELHQQGITLVVVTHDVGVAHRAERIVTLRDGEIIEDRQNVPTRTHETGSLHANETISIYEDSESLLSNDISLPPNGNGHNSVNGDGDTIDQLVARAVQRHMAEQAEATNEAI